MPTSRASPSVASARTGGSPSATVAHPAGVQAHERAVRVAGPQRQVRGRAEGGHPLRRVAAGRGCPGAGRGRVAVGRRGGRQQASRPAEPRGDGGPHAQRLLRRHRLGERQAERQRPVGLAEALQHGALRGVGLARDLRDPLHEQRRRGRLERVGGDREAHERADDPLRWTGGGGLRLAGAGGVLDDREAPVGAAGEARQRELGHPGQRAQGPEAQPVERHGAPHAQAQVLGGLAGGRRLLPRHDAQEAGEPREVVDVGEGLDRREVVGRAQRRLPRQDLGPQLPRVGGGVVGGREPVRLQHHGGLVGELVERVGDGLQQHAGGAPAHQLDGELRRAIRRPSAARRDRRRAPPRSG